MKLKEKIKKLWIVRFFSKYFHKHLVFEEKDPFVFQYENKTDEVQEAILFGFNGYGANEEFGNKNISVSSLNEGVYYYQAVNQSAVKHFSINKIRIRSKDMDWYYTKSISYNSIDANGVAKKSTTVIVNHLDTYQQLSDVIDIRYFNNYVINSNTHFNFSVKENSIFLISVFPLYPKWVNYWQYKRIIKKEKEKNEKNNIYITPSKFTLKQYFKQIFKRIFN
jgi:hypothetical protein